MPFNENVDYSTINVTKGTPPALVPSSEIDKLVANITNATSGSNKMGDDEVTVALAIICQKGGTAKKANPNIYANVNGKVLELGLVRKVITDINWKYTLRQFARKLLSSKKLALTLIFQVTFLKNLDVLILH